MSLKPRPSDPIPDETRRVALAVFPKGNRYLRLRDEFGELFTDELFTDLFSTRGQPAEAPGRLALVTVMQFAEGLSDRQAADAVRSRIDWKYALGLPLEDPGFDASVLVEFRGRLLEGGVEAKLLDTLLTRFREAYLLKTRGRQRTDSTSVAGGDPHAQSSGVCGRGDASRAQRPGRGGAGLAARAHTTRVGGTLRTSLR